MPEAKLKIQGVLFPFNKMSRHFNVVQPDGHLVNVGGVVFYPGENFEKLILHKLPGLRLLGPNIKTRIGEITRAWVDGDLARFEGLVDDTPGARLFIGTGVCRICLALNFLKGVELRGHMPGTEVPVCDDLAPAFANIVLDQQAAFPDAVVEFADKRLRIKPQSLMGARLPDITPGKGW